jgi:hypothetical protein
MSKNGLIYFTIGLFHHKQVKFAELKVIIVFCDRIAGRPFMDEARVIEGRYIIN